MATVASCSRPPTLRPSRYCCCCAACYATPPSGSCSVPRCAIWRMCRWWISQGSTASRKWLRMYWPSRRRNLRWPGTRWADGSRWKSSARRPRPCCGWRCSTQASRRDGEREERLGWYDWRTPGHACLAQHWLPPMLHPDHTADAELMDGLVAMVQRQSAQSFAGQTNALLERPDATPLLAQIACPTLLGSGVRTRGAPLGAASGHGATDSQSAAGNFRELRAHGAGRSACCRQRRVARLVAGCVMARRPTARCHQVGADAHHRMAIQHALVRP